MPFPAINLAFKANIDKLFINIFAGLLFFSALSNLLGTESFILSSIYIPMTMPMPPCHAMPISLVYGTF